MLGTLFHAYGTSHLSALALAAAIGLVMIWQKHRWMEIALATILLLAWPSAVLGHWLANDLSRDNGLPFHLCDVAAWAGAIALWKKHPLACELVYFFGLAGTLQGLITPNLQEDFPSMRFFVFFFDHCGVVIAALYVVLGMKVTPRPWAALRMMGCILSYALVVGLINAVIGTNYGFLCAKPPVASLMDSLGSWPWYIGGMICLATVFFALLDLPFFFKRRN